MHHRIHFPIFFEIQMELSEEQLRRMEENKQRAIAIRLLRNSEERKDNSDVCQFISANSCKSESVDPLLKEVFNENVCSICKLKSNDFDLITKSEVQASYLIPEDTIKTMKFTTKTNKHNSHWAPMHLYLRKHAKELSIKRFGSLEAMEEEKKSREKKKFQRDNAKTENILETQTLDFKKNLDPSVQSLSNTIGQKRKAAQSCKSQKKRDSLKSLIDSIRGQS